MEKLIDCLSKCADAHGKRHEILHDIYDADGHDYASFAIYGDSVPLLADVMAIVGGFCGREHVTDLVGHDSSFGCLEVFLSECRILSESEIDWLSIRLALPCDFTHITI